MNKQVIIIGASGHGKVILDIVQACGDQVLGFLDDFSQAEWCCGAPILGKIGDVIGRRKTLLLGIVVFTLGNILSALANSLIFMMLARFIVGVGTAAIGPVILAYIATEFPQDKIAKGFSLYMLLSSASVIIGPTIGGLIVSAYGWRTMLWVCVFICAGVFAACTGVSCPEGEDRCRECDAHCHLCHQLLLRHPARKKARKYLKSVFV